MAGTPPASHSGSCHRLAHGGQAQPAVCRPDAQGGVEPHPWGKQKPQPGSCSEAASGAPTWTFPPQRILPNGPDPRAPALLTWQLSALTPPGPGFSDTVSKNFSRSHLFWTLRAPPRQGGFSRADRPPTRSRKAGNGLREGCACSNPIFLWETVHLSTRLHFPGPRQPKDSQGMRAPVPRGALLREGFSAPLPTLLFQPGV